MSLIARNTDDLDKIRDCLNKVDAASRQLLGIINDILDISKIEARKMELGCDPFELRATIYNIKSIMTVRIAEKKQNIAIQIADDVPHVVVGDDMRLSQILLNLLSNAVKFTPDGGNITLTARLLSAENGLHKIQIQVIDDGIGISPEQQARLFNSFEQTDRSTAKRYGGSGLGLVISKSIAELMGGTITLESEPGRKRWFASLPIRSAMM